MAEHALGLNEHAPAGSMIQYPTLDDMLARARITKTFWSEHFPTCHCSMCRDKDGKQHPVLVSYFEVDPPLSQRESGTAPATSTSRARSTKKDFPVELL